MLCEGLEDNRCKAGTDVLFNGAHQHHPCKLAAGRGHVFRAGLCRVGDGGRSCCMG